MDAAPPPLFPGEKRLRAPNRPLGECHQNL